MTGYTQIDTVLNLRPRTAIDFPQVITFCLLSSTYLEEHCLRISLEEIMMKIFPERTHFVCLR